jgi:hypothetical protein
MHGEKGHSVHTPGDVSVVRIEHAAAALGLDEPGVRQLVRAGELVGYELVHVPSLVAFQRRLEGAAA